MTTQPNEFSPGYFSQLVKQRWPKLTLSDVVDIGNDLELLIETLQERYGLSSDDADQQVHEFEVANKIPDFESQTCRRYLHA